MYFSEISSLYAKIHLHGIEGDELHGGHGAVDGSADHCNDLYKSAVLPGISALPDRDRAGVSVLLRAWIFPCADACVFP